MRSLLVIYHIIEITFPGLHVDQVDLSFPHCHRQTCYPTIFIYLQRIKIKLGVW